VFLQKKIYIGKFFLFYLKIFIVHSTSNQSPKKHTFCKLLYDMKFWIKMLNFLTIWEHNKKISGKERFYVFCNAIKINQAWDWSYRIRDLQKLELFAIWNRVLLFLHSLLRKTICLNPQKIVFSTCNPFIRFELRISTSKP
jgi:hypothetical protein